MADNPEHSVRKQIEYYFSRENLATDTYMASVMDKDRWISLDVIAKFPKLLSLTTNHDLIVSAARGARNCQVDGPGKRIRPFAPRDTVIVRDIPADVDQAALRALFKPSPDAEDGIVSLRSDVGDTWFVQLAGETEAQAALQRLQTARFQDKPVKARMKSAAVAVAALPPPNVPGMGFGASGMGMGMGGMGMGGMGMGGMGMGMGGMDLSGMDMGGTSMDLMNAMMAEGFPDMLAALSNMQGMDISGAGAASGRKPSSSSSSVSRGGRGQSSRGGRPRNAARSGRPATAGAATDVALGGDMLATFAGDAAGDKKGDGRRRERGARRRRDGEGSGADGKAARRTPGRGRREGGGRRGADGAEKREGSGRGDRRGRGDRAGGKRRDADAKAESGGKTEAAKAESAPQPVAALSSAMHFPPLMRSEDLAAATASGYTARFNQFLKEDVEMLVRGIEASSLTIPESMRGHSAVVNASPHPGLVNKVRTDSMDIAVRHGKPIRPERAESLDYASMMYGEQSEAVAKRQQAKAEAALASPAKKRAPAPYAAALLSPAKPTAGAAKAKTKGASPTRKLRAPAAAAAASGEATGARRSTGSRGKATRAPKPAPKPVKSLGPRGWERPEVTEADRQAAKAKAEKAAADAKAKAEEEAAAAAAAEEDTAAAGAGEATDAQA